MIEQLSEFINLIKNESLRTDLEKYLSFYEFELKFYPASISHHHNGEGGLLKHTLEVADLSLKIADFLEDTYDLNINTDHLVFASLIHDIGKIKEYYFDRKSGVWKYTRLPFDMDHSLYPILDYQKKMNKPLPLEISSMILAHMGSWSKILSPDDLETAILHASDLISSRLFVQNLIRSM